MHTVVQTPAFIAAAVEAGMTDDEVSSVVTTLASRPDLGDIMPGTGGARKLRIAGRGKGKSGGFRVITFFAADDIPVFLLDCYGKGDKANLTKAERNELSVILSGIVNRYRDGSAARAAQRRR